ncbi:MAG: pirin family protein [Phycisphaerales bacterium JB060]
MTTTPTTTPTPTPTRKTIDAVLPAPAPHWVGDGFPVRTMFSVGQHGPDAITPFLMLDLAGPHGFDPDPTGAPRGVDAHPHRGFETVTILYKGELEHRDSAGGAGRLGPGDVQWMTAGAGIVHEEKHSAAFTKSGGTLEMVQLWVNLPRSDKNAPPRYQDIAAGDIPSVELPEGAGSLRVMAGEYQGACGAASTFTPMDVWDLALNAGASASLTLPEGRTAIVLVLRGAAAVGDAQLTAPQGVALTREGSAFEVAAGPEGALVLVLSGRPIDEPVFAHGPFVLSGPDELGAAIADYRAGRMGRLD